VGEAPEDLLAVPALAAFEAGDADVLFAALGALVAAVEARFAGMGLTDSMFCGSG
jgi:hypothetical protein